ncbi:MAG: pyridoxamine 5'-phosphate oxidase family protein [Verrucomicrobiota bacterium]
MADRYMHEVLTPKVLAAESEYYGRQYSTYENAPEPEPLRPQEVKMIQSRDSFYMATITENGWPYLQHRGGPSGFLRVTGPREIAFADYGGNRQLISVGSLSANNRVALFLMDYPLRTRLKMLGHAEVLDARAHPDWVETTTPPGGHASKPERMVKIEILSYDWNCPKFITPRFTGNEVQEAVQPLQDRIRELEREIETLKG